MKAYHVAPAAAREAIATHGLIASAPRKRFEHYGLGDQPAGVYVWDRFERAMRWAADLYRLIGDELGLCDVYRVAVPPVVEVAPDPVLGHQGALFISSGIDPGLLRLVVAEVRDRIAE